MTLIRASQPGGWPNQTFITVAQKPNTGKPIQQQTSNPLNRLIGRIKQDPSIDEQQQRSDTNDSKQLIYQSLMNKTPINRLPTTTATFIQQPNQPQQWHPSISQGQINPPPTYTTATRPRHPTIMQQQGPNPATAHTLIAPLRAASSTTTPQTFIARTSSSPNLAARLPLNVALTRPTQFSSSQPQQQQQPQDPSPR